MAETTTTKGGAVQRVLLALVLLAAVLAGGLARADGAYSFAVAPQFPPRQLYETWNPIVDEIARRTGLKLALSTTLAVPEFEQGLSHGAFDFVYANPYHILRESKRQGYIPLIRDNVPLTGILVVARDSAVRSPADLNGKTLAVPSLNAVGAALLMRADLEQIFHVHVHAVSVKTHSSVYLNVANGLADAGGGVQKTLQQQEESVRGALRTIYTTRAMPSHPVAAHPRVSRAAREAVRQALLDMAATPQGRALLVKVPMTQPVAASIDDYLVMSTWGLEKYWVEESE
jgi:phosphonate transport system substrate-binding protein